MFSSQGKVLLKNFLQRTHRYNLESLRSNMTIKYMRRHFSASHAHKEHNSHDTHKEHDDHDDHHDDHHGHHEISGEVDLNKVYVDLNSKLTPFISLTGVPLPEKVQTHVIEGVAKAKAEITPIPVPFVTSSRIYHNDLQSVRKEDNPYFHSEPYGYLITDDVFIFLFLAF
jgi:hypothetical protein